MHLAAESHVDRSITGPAAFIETNIVGTYVLLKPLAITGLLLIATRKKKIASVFIIFLLTKSMVICLIQMK